MAERVDLTSRVGKLEERINLLEAKITVLDENMTSFRTDVRQWHAETMGALNTILRLAENLRDRPAFRWPWEQQHPHG